MHAAILERNKLVGRRVARVFAAVGAKVTLVEEPAELVKAGDVDVVCGDAFDGDLIAEQVRSRAGVRGVLWTAEPLRRSLPYLAESAIDHVLARRDFESPPRAWEMMLVARRLAQPAASVPPDAFLAWGAESIELPIGGSGDRDHVVARVQELVRALQVPNRFAEMFGELAHELIMNAVYDAPVDAAGQPKYAADRKASVELAADERPTLRFATDGTVVVLTIRDPFGRLERRHVVDGLIRGLAGELDRTHGGAGLGLSVCHHASTALMFEVAAGRATSVTALCELDINMRELRGQAKSLHWWSH